MARPRKNKPMKDHLLISNEPKTEWQKALAHLEENYKLYIAGVVFILLCIAIGALIRLNTIMKEREIMTRYAEVALIEDAAERLEMLQDIASEAGPWTAEVLFRMGETAVEVNDYETARRAYETILADHGNSQYALHATDGLAFLSWNDGELDAALAGFERITTQWPNEFMARRKHYDIARVHEDRGDFEAAVAAYQKQIEVFPESAVARRAEQALEQLREARPELFPEPESIAPVEVDDPAQTAPLSPDPTTTYELTSDAPVEEDTADMMVIPDDAE